MGFCYERLQRYAPGIGWLLARAGRRVDALRIVKELQASVSAPPRYASAFDVGMIYAGLNENEQTLRYLQRAMDRREADVITLKMHPAFDALRGDPRFRSLLQKTELQN